MLIKIDNRESRLIIGCKKLLEENPCYKDIQLIVENLPVGDIILMDNGVKIIIERKSISDLFSSIKDGRYEEQSFRLNGNSLHNHNILYLLEGNINMHDNKDKMTFYSTITSLNYFKGFSVIRTMNIDESIFMICQMAYKIDKSYKLGKKEFYGNTLFQESSDLNDPEVNNHYCNVIKQVKKENITKDNIGEIMLCQIPGISSFMAIIIMEEFKTLSNLINKIREDENCLKNFTYKNAAGKIRKMNKTALNNIIHFLQ